ncbi:MAG: hypothetical protein P8Y97_20120 [Candidatus Lokiarchaeota archaeon]
MIINKVIEKVEKAEDKANYLDSKGDFYKMEGNISRAIEYYKKSLEIEGDSEFPFREDTKNKLKECEKMKLLK